MAYLAAADDEYLLVLDLPGQYETPSWLHLWKFPSHGATEKCELEKMDGSVGQKKRLGRDADDRVEALSLAGSLKVHSWLVSWAS